MEGTDNKFFITFFSEIQSLNLHDLSGSLHVVQFCIEEYQDLETPEQKRNYFERIKNGTDELAKQIVLMRHWQGALTQMASSGNTQDLWPVLQASSQMFAKKTDKIPQLFGPVEPVSLGQIEGGLEFILPCLFAVKMLLGEMGCHLEGEFEFNRSLQWKFFVKLEENWEEFFDRQSTEIWPSVSMKEMKEKSFAILKNVYLGKSDSCHLEYVELPAPTLILQFKKKR